MGLAAASARVLVVMSIPYPAGTGYSEGFLPLIASYIVAKAGDPYTVLWYRWAVMAVALGIAAWGLKGGLPHDFAEDAAR